VPSKEHAERSGVSADLPHEEKHAPPTPSIKNVQLSKEDIFAKRKQLGITLIKTKWFLGCKSKLYTSNKLHIYKTILKPIWTYGIQLWGTAFISNIEILEDFQSKALRMIVDAPWYVPNTVCR
jgi:hypothetical protein